jgi:hypothetical protein
MSSTPRSFGLTITLLLAACGGDDGNDGSDTATSVSASDGTTADTMPTSDGPASVGSDDDAPSDTSMVPTEASASSDDDASSGNDTAATTGGGALVPCTESSSDCGEGMSCRLAECCDDVGFCVPDDARTCGGFIGMACPAGLSCVLDACVADGSGPCVDPEIAAALQAEQQSAGPRADAHQYEIHGVACT